VVAAYSSMGGGRITQMSYLLHLSLRASEKSVKRKSNFRECGFSALGLSFFDGGAPAKTRAHLSDAQCQRIRLSHLLYPPTTCSTPMPRRRLWARVYCCHTADKDLDTNFVGFSFLRDLQEKERADERTRTADLLITRKHRRVSGGWRLFQNPLDKPNPRTSNILEQPEIGAGWCTVGVQILASSRLYSVKLATGTKGLE
jgi:hypothetical protein